MEKRVIVDQVTIDFKNGGHKLIRFCKQIVDDDGTVLSEQFHRTSIDPDGDMAAQMDAVNSHLEQGLKVGKVSDEEVAQLTALEAALAPIIEPNKDAWVAAQIEAGNRPAPIEVAVEAPIEAPVEEKV